MGARGTIALVFMLMLIACGASSRPMPNLTDQADVEAAISSLSPYEDGSADRSPDGRYPGQSASDRRVFLRWIRRVAEHETYARYSESYEPFPVPSTIGEALAQQRAFEAQRKADTDAADAAAAGRRAAEEQDAAEQLAEDKRQREEQEAAAQAEADRRTEAERLAAEKQIADDQERRAADERQRRADDPGYDCRARRQEAATAAEEKQPGIGAYNRAWNSIRCE